MKVLDFGLAKLTQPSGSGAFAPGVTASPTITTPAMTGIGMILGTAAYMAPEQARGKPVDKRADIWAFGCVLYEMLTGRRAFDGDDVTMVTASIVKSEPDWNALPAETPDAVRAVLHGCLQKDRGAASATLATCGSPSTVPLPWLTLSGTSRQSRHRQVAFDARFRGWPEPSQVVSSRGSRLGRP